MQFRTWSYRFADQVLNGQIVLKDEVEGIVHGVELPGGEYKRAELSDRFLKSFKDKTWKLHPRLFDEVDVNEDTGVPMSKIDFLKGRVGVAVQFGHDSFIGIDFLKFQALSYENLDKIDVGVYIVATNALHKATGKAFNGSVMFERVKRYLPHFKSAIHVPIWVVGLLPS